MNAVMKTWRDGPYIFIVQISSTAKDSTTRVKRPEGTPPSSHQNKPFTSKVTVFTVSYNYNAIFYVYQAEHILCALIF